MGFIKVLVVLAGIVYSLHLRPKFPEITNEDKDLKS